jgi:flagellar hook-length control protein FliK
MGSELTGESLKAAMPDIQLHVGPDLASAPADGAVRLAVPTSLGAFQVTQIPGFEVAAPAPAPGSPLPAETTSSIIQSLRMQYQAGGGDAIVHIKPEHLGPVSVSLRVENGVVSAVVTAENPAVAEWLKANEHMLRDGLSSSGLHLERFAVRRDGHPAEDGRKGYQPPEPKDRRRRALPSESTFEVTV